ncbi:MAG: VIT domain-containing protein [Elusimicrobiota bacterium]
MRKALKLVAVGLVVLILPARAVIASGFMVIDGSVRERSPGYMSVKSHRINTEIKDGIAVTTIEQVFKNDLNREVEGTYIFPLPESAAVSDFSMYMNGEKVSGEVMESDEARGIYENIVRSMKDPALLEYIGRDIFKARIYPIEANSEKKIEIKYEQTLKYDNGVYEYVYPLNTERFSSQSMGDVSLKASIDSSVPIKNVYSPTHEMDLKIKKHSAVCGFEYNDVSPRKDFKLFYSVSKKDLGLSVLSYRKENHKGYYLMLFSPGKIESKSLEKDIIFVIDTSGSMSGKKILQAKESLRFCLNSLNEKDRFNIVSFATDINEFSSGMVTAEYDNVNEALEYVDNIRAVGGTDINAALTEAVKKFSGGKRPNMVVFLTDGRPTTGLTQPKRIIRNVKEANKMKARLFVFGVGYNVNTHLLDELAWDNRGSSDYVQPSEDIEVTVSSFYRKISEPILSEPEIEINGIKISEVYPRDLPDIFKGTRLVTAGRYEGNGKSKIVLSGKINGKSKKFTFEGNFAREDQKNDFIPRIWARRKIGGLMRNIRLEGTNQELVNEITRVGKKYGIITPYTSYLITEEARAEDEGVPESFKEMRLESAQATRGFKDSTGRESVMMSKEINRMSASEVNIKDGVESVKNVAGKTFYLINEIWTDSEYEEETDKIKVKYLSEEYFELLRDKSKLAKYFSVGEKVIVVFNERCYEVY